MRTAVASFAVMCVVGVNLSAQAPATSFEELSGKLRIGSTVYVTDTSGRQTKAKLADLSPSSLELITREGRRTFDAATVQKITERRRNTGRGAKWGFLAGVALGVAGAVNDGEGCPPAGCQGMDSPFLLAALVATIGGMGAGVGAIIGSGSTRDRLIYTAPTIRSPKGLTVAPVVHRNGVGIISTVRF